MKTVLLAAAAAAALLACAAPASANVLFSSGVDPSTEPQAFFCSTCSFILPAHQYDGEFFTLGSNVTAQSLTLAISAANNLTPITVGLYQNAGGVLGSKVYGHTFTSYPSDVRVWDSPFGFEHTDVVSMDLGDLALVAGNYVLMFSNSTELHIPGYAGGAGHGVFDDESVAEPGTGDLTRPLAIPTLGTFDLAVTISGHEGIASGAPEPGAWALMVGGFGLAGGMLRRRGMRAPAA